MAAATKAIPNSEKINSLIRFNKFIVSGSVLSFWAEVDGEYFCSQNNFLPFSLVVSHALLPLPNRSTLSLKTQSFSS